MAEDFIELAIEGADKLVDKHFHKVPDKVLQSQTYNPREIRKRYRRRRRPSTPSSSKSDTEPMSADPRQNSVGAVSAPPPPEYTYMPYSHDPPQFRPQYAPSPPPIGQPYFPPPPQSVGYSQVQRYDDDDDDDGYYSDRKPHRPKAITRRSSSYHGPRGRDDYEYNDKQLARRRRGSSQDGSDMVSKSKDAGRRHGLKEEVEGFFTKSPAGITGAVAGAVVGGWVAKKAQVASGREGKHHGSNSLVTLLGAAVGGLAVNAVVDKFEDRKKETAEKERVWEEKWGSEDERDERRGRRDSGHSRGRRHRSRSYSSDRYD